MELSRENPTAVRGCRASALRESVPSNVAASPAIFSPSRRVDSELDVSVVVSVVRRVGDLEALPPLAADHLVILVLPGLQVEEVAIHGRQHAHTSRVDAAHHVADALATLKVIQCASTPDLDVGAPQIDANEIDGPGATRVGELIVRHTGRELAGCCNLRP